MNQPSLLARILPDSRQNNLSDKKPSLLERLSIEEGKRIKERERENNQTQMG